MVNDQTLPQELRDQVDRELEPGEPLRWVEMPIPRLFTPASTGAFLFGIPWTAFALFWTGGAAFGVSKMGSNEGPWGLKWAFPLFGLPFILIGLAMLSSPWWARRAARRTVYVITDRRAICFQGGWSTTIRSYSPEQLSQVYRKERKDGTGDVIIGVRGWRDSDGDRRTVEEGFLRVRDPKTVEAMLKGLATLARPVGGDRL
jgi:hypothetical protein